MDIRGYFSICDTGKPCNMAHDTQLLLRERSVSHTRCAAHKLILSARMHLLTLSVRNPVYELLVAHKARRTHWSSRIKLSSVPNAMKTFEENVSHKEGPSRSAVCDDVNTTLSNHRYDIGP